MTDIRVTLIGLATALMVILPGRAWASLQVFPTRVVLTDKVKVANISLRHIGAKPCRYKIKTVFYRMKPDGSLDLAKEATESEHPAMKLIRFSPRETTLSPNLEQVVRVLYAGPRTLAEGEYRAHLHFEPLDDDELDSGGSDPGKLKMQLTARVAIAVPVVYRQGNPSFTASLSNLKLVKIPGGRDGFAVDMSTTGNAFAYGDFHLYYFSRDNLIEANRKNRAPIGTSIGLVRGVASYIPNRLVQYPISIPDGVRVEKGGKVRLEFRSPEDKGSKLIQAIEANL